VIVNDLQRNTAQVNVFNQDNEKQDEIRGQSDTEFDTSTTGTPKVTRRNRNPSAALPSTEAATLMILR